MIIPVQRSETSIVPRMEEVFERRLKEFNSHILDDWVMPDFGKLREKFFSRSLFPEIVDNFSVWKTDSEGQKYKVQLLWSFHLRS